MNERIKELLEQAGVKYIKMPTDTVYEKFAELIVRDCMELCVDKRQEYFNYRKDTSDVSEKDIYAEGEAACDILHWLIKSRFGVEE